MTTKPLAHQQLIDDIRWLAARWEAIATLHNEYIRQSKRLHHDTQDILQQLANHFAAKDEA